MTDYTAKYRPQKISELDLTAVREGLIKVLKSGKIPHAFLFCGPRGTGKTSAARIIAKAVNCLERNDFEPCNQCEQCLSVTAGTNLDVLEIDAASNRGIDDIRDLREKIKLAPSKARFKVYIIDEVHMLTTEAFNALLKTLEEPPEHAIFILCTTEPEKLPETIISRCLRFNFKRATIEEIVAKLKKVCATEKLEVEEGVLEEIAKSVSGSFRDAQKILEQASFSQGKINLAEIKEILGQVTGINPEKLIALLVKRDARAAIAEIGEVVKRGGNLKVYVGRLLEILRRALLANLGVLEWDEGEAEVGKITGALKTEEIKILIDIFSRAAMEERDAVIPQLPLELAVVEWCEKEGGGLVVSSESVSKTPTGVSLEDVQARWKEILLAVRPRNHSVEALLRATRPIDFREGFLTLEVFYKFHKDQLETEKCRKIVEEAASDLLGGQVRLKCVLKEKTATKEPKQFTPLIKPGNGETTDEDIIKVAEEIFSGIME